MRAVNLIPADSRAGGGSTLGRSVPWPCSWR
jgi:hypothetical protein